MAWTIGLPCAACAGSDPVSVGPSRGSGGTGEFAPETSSRSDESCASGESCGDACCGADQHCEGARCVSSLACQTGDDCDADTICGGGHCLPFDLLPANARYAASCREPVDLPSLTPVVQCRWPGDQPPEVAPDSVQVIGTPMVVDFDLDDDPSTLRPSIVFVSYSGVFSEETGILRVIDGRTCELTHSIVGEFPFPPEVSPALGDVDGDGRPDIVAIDEEQVGAAPRSGVALFSYDGSGFAARWRRRSSATELIQGVSLHDLDDDGSPEILTETTIVRSNGVESVTLPGGALQPPVVMDVDGDRYTAEIVTSKGIFTWNVTSNRLVPKPRIPGDADCDPDRTCLWNHASDVEGRFVAASDLRERNTAVNGGGDSVELVIVGRTGEIWVKQIDGRTIHRVAPTTGAGGPPVVADFDGDGRMEFASAGREYLTVYDLDCKDDEEFLDPTRCGGGRGEANDDAILWRRRSQGANSGAAVFDFDGDGRTEVVYADQCYMRIYDGVTGDVAFSLPRSSTTRWEYPVVADVDGDGHSEIVTGSNDNDLTLDCPDSDPLHPETRRSYTHGITVWAEANDRWQGSRPVWNQHAYYVTNVHDDGSVPASHEVVSYRDGPNTFRQNALGTTGIPLSRVDLTVRPRRLSCLSAQGGEVGFDFQVCNRGLLESEPGAATVAVSLSGAGVESVEACSARIDAALAPGECQPAHCTYARAPADRPFDVRFDVDGANDVAECFEENNSATLLGAACLTVPR